MFSFADNRGVEMTSVAPDAADTTARGGAPRMAHRAVASDVTLQMLISFNVYFSVCFWVATVVATFVKTNGAREDFDEIRPVMICMYAVFEPARLYAGFAGNLQEQVPMLIGFVALSFCVALPLHFYFLAGQMGAVAFDKALNLFAVVYVVAQVVAGVVAARKILASQSLSFFMSELDCAERKRPRVQPCKQSTRKHSSSSISTYRLTNSLAKARLKLLVLVVARHRRVGLRRHRPFALVRLDVMTKRHGGEHRRVL